jgi:sugar porter (SP) family MFS transporter
VNKRLGRRGAIFIGCFICVIANIASSLSQTWQSLLSFRILLGLGLGINKSTISVFAAECTPSYIRGGLAVSWQMFTAFGLFLGFAFNASVHNLASPWRYQLAFPFLPALLVVGLVFMCPESPAWLMRRHRYDLAFYALKRVRNADIQAAKEVYSTYLYNQGSHGPAPSYGRKLVEIFTIPRLRRATLASFTVMLAQQLCGINIIAFYSSSIFSDAGFTTYAALLASTGFGFLNFVGAFPAIWTMDTLGRRSLLLLTLPIMAITMLGASMSFAIPKESSAHFWLLATMIYLFCAEYSPGMGPVPMTYSAEVFPISHREVGMSFAVFTTNLWASVLSLTFPQLLSAMGPQGAFTLYASFNVLAFFLVLLFVPETKMKTLDELDEVFSVSSRRFARYQVVEYMPWCVNRYLWRRNMQLSPSESTLRNRRVSTHSEQNGDA